MFDPEKLLNFVELIRRKSELQTEAGVRTALNRSYFSVMLKAKTRLESSGTIFSDNEEIHQEVVEKIKEKNSKLGDKLNNLLEYRIKADFDLEFNANKDLITPIFGLAKSFNYNLI